MAYFLYNNFLNISILQIENHKSHIENSISILK